MSRLFRRVLVLFLAVLATAGCVDQRASAGGVAATDASESDASGTDPTGTDPTGTDPPGTTTSASSHAAPPSSDASGPTAALEGLRVAPEGARAGYRRQLFRHWVDADRDGCTTREEVLIAESRSAAQVDPYGCRVVAGDWYSLYDGLTFTDPAELQIDHVVALAEAWDSGASGWDAARREAFANDLDHSPALRAVSASANQSKSDLDPGQWKPTSEAAWCEYADDWVTVKKAWDLSADQNEVDDLRLMLSTCGESPPPSGAPASPSSGSAAPATTTSPAAVAADRDGGSAIVAALDCRGERVTVRNGGSTPADLTGWTLHDEGARHSYRFAAGSTLAPGASVTIRSGGPAGERELPWTNQNVWNNTGDTASLLNGGAALVSTLSCTS